jgi:hypothetical protein
VTREQALEMLSIEERTFDALVEAHRLPGPMPLNGRRKIWNVEKLRAAWNSIAGMAPETVDSLLEHIRNA